MNLVPVFEAEQELRKYVSFPLSLWLACKEQTGEPDGGVKTTELYRAAIPAVAEASGIHEIGKEHVGEALKLARLNNPRADKTGATA